MPTFEDSIKRLIEEGVVRPPSAAFPTDLLERSPQCKPATSILEALLEERSQGR